MLTELQGLSILLSRWRQHPEAPASELSPFSADACRREPFSVEEITRMKDYIAEHAPTQFRALFQIDVEAEVDRYFDDSSVPRGDGPRIVMLMGGVAVGKTTIRKQRFARGYVLVDAAEIFLSLSRGEVFTFPEAFEQEMNVIGGRVARRAISERRNIVTELIGADYEATKQLIDAMLAVGYLVSVEEISCDIGESARRNLSRGEDNISCYYAEGYQRRWLLDAAHAFPEPPAA